MAQKTVISALALLAASLVMLPVAGNAAQTKPNVFVESFGNSYAPYDHDDARDAVRAGKVISMEQALASVRQRYPGRLLDATFDRINGLYHVKMLTRGEVIVVAVNARNGRIENVQGSGR